MISILFHRLDSITIQRDNSGCVQIALTDLAPLSIIKSAALDKRMPESKLMAAAHLVTQKKIDLNSKQ